MNGKPALLFGKMMIVITEVKQTSFYSGLIRHIITYKDLIAMYQESKIHASVACLDVFLFVHFLKELMNLYIVKCGVLLVNSIF